MPPANGNLTGKPSAGNVHFRPAGPDLGLLDALDRVEAILTRYVVFQSTAQRIAVTLWIAHTHVLGAFDVTPYLHLRSAEKRSGKTLLLELIAELVPRPWLTIQPTEAVLFRKMEQQQPTLLLDETDAIFGGPSSERTEGLRALLNAGYRRGATVDRCIGREKDKIAAFRVFGAKALGGIGALPGTVGDRSIPIELRRKKKAERVARFRRRDVVSDAEKIRKQLAAWAEIPEVEERLRRARPAPLDQLGDRANEVWETLLAIAEFAGGEWPERARSAAIELAGNEPDTESVGVQLLKAIFEILNPKSSDSESCSLPPIEQMATSDLLAALLERESEPWGQWWGRDVQQGIQGPATKLAGLLKPFDIQPGPIRDGKKVYKGYKRANFIDAWERYTNPGKSSDEPFDSREPESSPGNAAESSYTVTTAGAQGFEPLPQGSGNTPAVTAETLRQKGCHSVTAVNL
jgi:Protein of unknown function (DUF3631)